LGRRGQFTMPVARDVGLVVGKEFVDDMHPLYPKE